MIMSNCLRERDVHQVSTLMMKKINMENMDRCRQQVHAWPVVHMFFVLFICVMAGRAYTCPRGNGKLHTM